MQGVVISTESGMGMTTSGGGAGEILTVSLPLQLSSLQRAVSINNMAHLSLPRGSGLANGRTVSGRDSDPVPSLPAIHTPSPAPPPPSHIIASRLPNHVAVETAHITLESTLDLESDVEFAQLPVKMTAVSLAHTPNR